VRPPAGRLFSAIFEPFHAEFYSTTASEADDVTGGITREMQELTIESSSVQFSSVTVFMFYAVL